jgi:hypothetical protein
MKIAVLGSLLVATLAFAQDPAGSQEAALQTLLKEVHALRVAMERSNQIAPKVQIALAKMQLQEQRVRNAEGQLRDARERIATVQSRSAKFADQIKYAETAETQAVDPTARKQLDAEILAMKSEVGQLNSEEQLLRAKEAEASSLVSTEQAKWNEINDLLTSIERSLAPIQP